MGVAGAKRSPGPRLSSSRIYEVKVAQGTRRALNRVGQLALRESWATLPRTAGKGLNAPAGVSAHRGSVMEERDEGREVEHQMGADGRTEPTGTDDEPCQHRTEDREGDRVDPLEVHHAEDHRGDGDGQTIAP